MSEKRTLNIAEVAEMLELSRSTISLAARQGTLPGALVLDGRVLFSRRAIENFLETGSFDGAGTAGVDMELLADMVADRVIERLGMVFAARVQPAADPLPAAEPRPARSRARRTA